MARKKKVKEEIPEIIDLGSWKVPTSWDEVTLKQFQEIEAYYDGTDKQFDARDVLHIFCGRSIDEINELPMDFVESIMGHLMFLQTKPEERKSTNKIEIDGELYVINVMEKLKVGEYVAVDTVMKADKHNYAAILAILCRKQGEVYDSRYEAEVLNDRIAMFERQPITNILPLVGFFLELYMILATPTLLSSRIREAIDLIRKDTEISVKNGEVSRRSMKSVMKKLRKLEQSLDSI